MKCDQDQPRTTAASFGLGDRVWHFGRREGGRVTDLTGGCVRVRFDKGGEGLFDANWFLTHPMLMEKETVSAKP